jgi:tripartite-type tricarboxylate transporter receptor subunit TctC
MKYRIVIAALAAATALPAAAQKTDPAANFPTRPIRIVVGFTPGGQPDIYARLISAKLGEALGQQVVIDNRPGAGGIIGAQIVVGAVADGQTLLSVSSAHVTAPAVRAKMPYDTVKDLAGVTLTANATYVLAVTPSLGVKTVQELIALAKSKPGQINFSSAGNGSGTHFAGEMFKQSAGIDVVHIPFKGIPESLTDTISGRVQFTMAPIASSVSLIKEGRLRALAVSSKKRSAIYPEVPTIAEAGLSGFEWDSWGGILAPAKTPRAVINKLNREIVRILALPDIGERLRALGAEPMPSTPADMDSFVAKQLQLATQIAKKAGIEPQ